MAGGSFSHAVRGYTFWDANGYWCGKYSCVSLATAAEVTAANAAGVPGSVGEICVATPVAAGFPTRAVLGVTQNSCKVGQEVRVAWDGTTWYMAGAAIALDAPVFAAVSETRTSAQTPFTDNPEMLVPVDPAAVPTYILVLGDDTALPGANTVHYPLGRSLKAAAAKYTLIPIALEIGYRR